MEKGMITCKACGREFMLFSKDHYISVENAKTGLASITGGEQPDLHDTFDCPHCGSQNIVGKRRRPWTPESVDVEEKKDAR